MRAINISFIFTLIFSFLILMIFAFISMFLYNHFIVLQGVSSQMVGINIQMLSQEYQRCMEQFKNETLCSYILKTINKPISYPLVTDIRFWVILAILLLIVSMVVYVTKRE